MKNLIVFLLIIFTQQSIFSQGLDVLPLDGRNELFHDFLMNKGAEIWNARRDSVAASLASVESLLERQKELKEDYISLLGTLPEKMPLNAVIVDTIQENGYRIENLAYESRPNFHVTANFYIPDGEGPFPSVLIMCGHYPVGKRIGLYQELSALFALNGIAALIVDPFSQGERNQIQSATTGNLLFAGQSGTAAHSRLDVGAVLAGTSVSAMALWDNHRGIDYLYSRTDIVDTTRVGATGSSGGGSQATYLVGFDDRIKVAAINSFLMNEETLYATIGPQTASQNLSYEGAHLIDHPDYLTMFAPKPMMILAATQDFFDVTATRATYEEAKKVYEVIGAPEKIGYFEEDATHGYLQPRREKAVQWFKTWFLGDTSAVSEPDDITLYTTELNVTEEGQVTLGFENEKTVTNISVELADEYAAQRMNFNTSNTADSIKNKVKELIRWEAYEDIQVEETEIIEREGYKITKLKINSGDHVPVTGLLMVPNELEGSAPGVIYVDGRGKNEDADIGGVLEKVFVDSNKVVLAIDVRGFGETRDNPGKNESKHNNNEHRNAVISAYIGKTLIGQRVEDIMKAIDYMVGLENVDASNLLLVGIDRAGTSVLHAAVLDERVSKTVIRQSYDSWLPLVSDPTIKNNMTHEIPFALEYYDMPDLVNLLPANLVTYYDDLYDIPSSTKEIEIIKSKVDLGQNFPNPADQGTLIPFEIKESGKVSIIIYDQSGKVPSSVFNGYKSAGYYEVNVDLSNYSNGIYYYQLWMNGYPAGTKKLIRLKK